MLFLRVIHRTRILMGLSLFGLFAFTVGCDGSGGGGVSNVTPSTPPPGQSAKDQAALRAKSYPTSGAAAKALGKPGEAAGKPAEAPTKPE